MSQASITLHCGQHFVQALWWLACWRGGQRKCALQVPSCRHGDLCLPGVSGASPSFRHQLQRDGQRAVVLHCDWGSPVYLQPAHPGGPSGWHFPLVWCLHHLAAACCTIGLKEVSLWSPPFPSPSRHQGQQAVSCCQSGVAWYGHWYCELVQRVSTLSNGQGYQATCCSHCSHSSSGPEIEPYPCRPVGPSAFICWRFQVPLYSSTLKCLPWRWCVVHLFPCWRVPVCSGAASTVLPAQTPVCPASSGNETPNLHPGSGLCASVVHGACLCVCQEKWGGSAPCVFAQGAYKVLEINNKFFSLKNGGCTEVVSVDHLKPHLGSADVAPAHWVAKFLLLLSLVFRTALAGGGGACGGQLQSRNRELFVLVIRESSVHCQSVPCTRGVHYSAISSKFLGLMFNVKRSYF